MRTGLYLIFILFLAYTHGFAEEFEAYMKMELDDLMNIKIESVSKKEESLFDAPLSSTVITREEILNSGAVSLQEALRLVPGLIVREQSPGNFDIHIRGFDNVPPDAYFPNSSNSITLVMIDNRPVYNYFESSTFWETLPVDINDVEKIEIVRGPSAALYGPNAVAGVINIITRRPEKEGPYFTADLQTGTHNSLLGNASLGYKYKDKFSIVLSGNSQQRDRHETRYYDIRRDIYLSDPKDGLRDTSGNLLTNPDERYPEPDLAVDKQAANAFIRFTPSDKFSFDISAGVQDSRVQKIYMESRSTPFTTSDSESSYSNAKVAIYGLSAQISYLSGEQNFTGIEAGRYDFDTLDVDLEYDFNRKHLNLKPGISYRRAVCDGNIIGGEQKITTSAAFLRADYTLFEKWRWIGAIRGDKYNYPDNTYMSYQLATTYKFSNKHLIRAAYARSNRAPSLVDIFMDLKIQVPGVYYFELSGNKDLDLITMDMYEIGYRSRISDHLTLDLETFYALIKDYSSYVLLSDSDPSAAVYSKSRKENLDLKAEQFGISAEISYTSGNTFYAKLFGTLQYSRLNDHSPDLNTELYRSHTSESGKHTATPLFYGGFQINYRPVTKLNLHTDAYYYTSQRFTHESAGFAAEPVFDIDPKLIWNAKITYNITDQVSFYINAKNLLNDKSQEFAWADEIGSDYFAGVYIEF